MAIDWSKSVETLFGKFHTKSFSVFFLHISAVWGSEVTSKSANDEDKLYSLKVKAPLQNMILTHIVVTN